jgi:hypothetical protein
MANVILPTIIQGPAYVTHGGVTTFVQRDIAITVNSESWNPETAYGMIGERLKARTAKAVVTPVGMVTAANLNYYYREHLAPATYIGTSMCASGLVIVSIPSALKYTWAKAAKTKCPSLHCGPGKTAFGSMEFEAIGDPAIQPLTAAHLKTAEEAAGALSTGFEESSITSDIYKAAYGLTPYDAMGSMDGFDIEFGLTPKKIAAGDVGYADIILASLDITASFAPSSLTETQVDGLLKLDGAEALLPGQEFARGLAASAGTPIDLAITGTQLGAAFTCKAVGAKEAGYSYQLGEHRLQAVKFVSSRRWATGAETALFSYTGVT